MKLFIEFYYERQDMMTFNELEYQINSSFAPIAVDILEHIPVNRFYLEPAKTVEIYSAIVNKHKNCK